MKRILCYMGIHRWKWFKSEYPFVVVYKCECGVVIYKAGYGENIINYPCCDEVKVV